MKRLSILIVLVSLMGINAFAQTALPARTPHLKTKLGAAKPALMGSSNRVEDCDTFFNLCSDDTLAIYYATANHAEGYISGQNVYGDVSKADIFQLPGTKISGVLIYFGLASAANTVDKFKVRIWDNDGSFYNGNPGAPGTVIGEKLIKYSDVVADVTNNELTYVSFGTGVTMPTDSIFYAGINFGYKLNDTVAMWQAEDRTDQSCEGFITAVEEWDPVAYGANFWLNLNDAWGFNGTSFFVLPITCSECILDVVPGGPDICPKKGKTLTASGATTYSWAPALGLDVTTGAVVIAEPDVTTTYTVTGDGGACGTKTVTVTVLEGPTSNFTIGACSAGARLLTRTGTPSVGVSFKWFRDGVKLGGQTNDTYSATISGEYKCQTKLLSTGCLKVSTEKTVTIDCKLGANDKFTAEAYPNPFTQSVTINMASGSSELANVRLVDLTGKTLHEYVGVDTSAPFEINETLAPGVYFVRVSQGTNEKMIKIVKD